MTRPSVRTTPIKTAEQQAARVTHRTHEPLLSRQRVTLINAIRGHMAEFGVLAPAGPQHVAPPIERIADPVAPIPAAAREALNVLAGRPARGARSPDRPAGGRDAAALPGGRRRRAAAHHSGCRACHRERGPGRRARHRRVPLRPRVRGVARPRAAPELERWQGPAGAHTKMGNRTIRRLLVTGAFSVIRWSRAKPGFAEIRC